MKIEIIPQGFNQMRVRLDNAGNIVRISANEGLRQIGKLLVGGGKGSGPLGQATPKGATGKLRSSTVFEIKRINEIDQQLEIRQGARTKKGSFYGHFVRGGTAPHFPPYRELIPWVQAVLGVDARKAPSVAFLVARKIGRVGTQANPYHQLVFETHKSRIQSIIDAMGRKVTAYLAGKQ